jgi:uncharacterized membrane protein YoaK (UPF0700 family)
MTRSNNDSKRWVGRHSWFSSLLGRDAMLLLLAWVGGSADAVSYLGLGHVFTANMSGNTILLGIAIGQGQPAAELRAFISLLGFCVGAGIGALLINKWSNTQEYWPVIITKMLAFESMLLAAFACIWYLAYPARSATLANVLIVISALAMGLQSAAILHLSISWVTTTYVSGTWTDLAINVVDALLPAKSADTAGASTRRKKKLALQIAVLTVYALAAAIVGLGELHWPKVTPFLSLLIVIFIVINATIRLHRPNQHGGNQPLP